MVRCPCAAVVQSIDAWGRFASRVSGCLVRLPPKRRPLPRRLQTQASGVCPPDSDILFEVVEAEPSPCFILLAEPVVVCREWTPVRALISRPM
jgi:hypothetical protein